MPQAAQTRLTVGLVALLGGLGLAMAATVLPRTTVAVGAVALLTVASAAYLVLSAEPRHIFTLAIVLAPFAGNWQQLGIPGAVAPQRLLIAGGIAAVLLRRSADAARTPLRFEAAHWMLALTALYAASSAFFAGTLFERVPGIQLVETFGIFPFLLFVLAPVVFPTARERETLLKGLVGLGAYLSLTTLFEITGPEALVFPRYISDPQYGIHFGYGRGPFADAVANGFALYACAVACAIAVVTWRRTGWRVVAGGIALLCLVGTLLTLERSVWISTVLASLVVPLVVRATRRWALAVVLVGAFAIVTALLVIPGLSASVSARAGDEQTVWDRRNLQHTALNMIQARPLVGVGWSRYLDEDTPYIEQSPDFPLTASGVPLHSVILTYAVELGLIGALLWIASLMLGVGGALAGRAPPDLQPWRVGLLALFVFFIVQESFVPPTVFQNLSLWLWAGVVWAGRYAVVEEAPAANPLASGSGASVVSAPSRNVPEQELLPAVLDAGRDLVRTAAAASWRGPDPYDGLLHPWPRALRGGRRRRQAIVQLHARAPFDVRKLYGRTEQPRIPKALGLFGQAALRLDAARSDPALRAQGMEALTLLAVDESAGDAWGYPFDVQTRWSYYPAGAPNVVVTSFAGRALGEAGRQLGERQFSERAQRAARWTLEHVFDPVSGTFSYHEHSDTVIHNANLLAAQLVWDQLRDDAAARDAVRQAVARSLAAQAPDGMWPYGEGAGLGWSDSFHTGFVLSSLVTLRELDGAVDAALVRGAAAYAQRFFGPQGEAYLWPDQPHPEDAHAAGTGMSTLAALRDLDLIDPALPARVTARVLAKTVVDGHAVWRRGRWGPTRVSYLRWCDAHVALGLADIAQGAVK